MKSGARSASVDKAFELLLAVAEAPGGLSLRGLAAVCGIAVSTCHRYAVSLLDNGLLERDSSGRFRLGMGLVFLAQRCLGDAALREAARPGLARLVELSGETARLGAYVRDSIVCVDKIDGPMPIEMATVVGSPMHCTSMGKAVLAHLSDEHRARRLGAPLAKRTRRTLIGEDLARDLELVRHRGYAIDDEENQMGVRCLGVPLLDGVRPIGALSVAGPAERFTVDDCVRLAPATMKIAKELSGRLAGAAPLVCEKCRAVEEITATGAKTSVP